MSTALKGYIHDPDSRLDYTFDWSSWLVKGETITGFTVAVSPSNHVDKLVASDSSSNGTKVTVWLSQGRKNAKYIVSCKITTNKFRTETASFIVAAIHK